MIEQIYIVGERVEVVDYRHDFGRDDLPGVIVDARASLSGPTTYEVRLELGERLRGIGIVSLSCDAGQLRRLGS